VGDAGQCADGWGRWRFVDAGPQTATEALARGPVLAQTVTKTGDYVCMTSVWGQTHLNVGWFDDVDATVDLDAARRLGVAVVRRPVFGGGTAFYQEGCAAMCSFLLDKDRHPDLDAELARFQPVFLDVLDRLGLSAVRFEGSSDLRWQGRKLGALIAQDAVMTNMVGGFLNLARPDVDLYLELARVPDDKFKDKAVKDLRDYIVPAEEIADRPVSYGMFRDAVHGALTDAGAEVYARPFTERELDGVKGIADLFAADDHLHHLSSSRFSAAAPAGSRVGFGNFKGHKLCRAGIAVDDQGSVVAAMLAGDMHVGPPDVLDRTAETLVGAPAGDQAELRRRLATVFEAPDVHQADAALGVTVDDLLAAVTKAVTAALTP
jgi:lipoate-protein ligase A